MIGCNNWVLVEGLEHRIVGWILVLYCQKSWVQLMSENDFSPLCVVKSVWVFSTVCCQTCLFPANIEWTSFALSELECPPVKNARLVSHFPSTILTQQLPSCEHKQMPSCEHKKMPQTYIITSLSSYSAGWILFVGKHCDQNLSNLMGSVHVPSIIFCHLKPVGYVPLVICAMYYVPWLCSVGYVAMVLSM